MSDAEMSRHDQVLLDLVFNLQFGAMHQLGKIQDPATGEMAKDLDQARSTIDVLEMLKVKCRADTPAEILRMLDSAVMDLQLNYMDEMKKSQTEAPTDEAPTDEEPADKEPAESGSDEESEKTGDGE